MSSDLQDDDTMEAIMQATYRALCANGYAETSISNIADEVDMSRGVLYYHYENKEAILTDFLTYILERFGADLNESIHTDPYDQLLDLVDRFVPADPTRDQLRFRQAYCEMRSQAPHNPAYQELLAETDERMHTELTAAISRGCETGEFRSVDAASKADFILSTAYGIMERSATFEDRELLAENRRQLLKYVEGTLR